MNYKILTLSGFAILALSLAVSPSLAYLSSGSDSDPILIASSLVNPLNYFNNNMSLPGLSEIKNIISNLSNQSSGTAGNSIFNSSIFNSGSFSTSDIPGALKSILALAINLFLIVIQTAAGILKALLPFLQ